MTIFNNITDVPGIKVGHAENHQALTGCTALIIENGAVCGVDVRGSAPGTIGTDGLHPIHSLEEVHGIILSGGSIYGLETASGVVQYLEEQKLGSSFGGLTLPLVAGAIIFDLGIGDGTIRPDKQMGYEAAKNAKRGVFPLGNVGAGCGATIGKVAEFHRAMKGGLGSVSKVFPNGLVVAAIVAVNPVGEVRDPSTGEILAGTRDDNGKIRSSMEWMLENEGIMAPANTNTTIGVVATNAILTKPKATKVAEMAHNGLAKTIYPIHTSRDGDTIFSLATGEIEASADLVGTLAADVMAEAVIEATKAAKGVAGLPAYQDLL